MTIERFLAMQKPPGEDFFAFSFIVDDPDHPTWETRQTTFGDWHSMKQTVQMLLALFELQNGRFEWYQGENARRYIERGAKDEKRFQQEREAAPNN